MRTFFFDAKLCGGTLVLAACFIFTAFSSCTRSSPTIAYSTMSLNYIEGDTGVTPSLSFFVLADDDDGYEDIDELRLYSDYEGLSWVFKADEWIRHDEAGNTWIGARNIAMAGGETFPSGQYRAVLVDKAGERSERTFGFDVPEIPRFAFPKLAINEDSYTITSEYPENYFLCYGQDGAYRRYVRLESKNAALSSLRLSSDILSVALWAHDPERSTSALTKTAAIR
ncbi:MAG: hypothetical protein LBJ86_06625 [Spirochaetaceae bacterium]|jgi:hypothetical protein|nr:hypothetical protein [Spirochaetaceae bacterium]